MKAFSATLLIALLLTTGEAALASTPLDSTQDRSAQVTSACAPVSSAVQGTEAPTLIAWGKKATLMEPPAAEPSPDNLVPPPGEEAYFPVRPDGQPFLLNIDSTVNLTEALSGFYFDPKWRGENWAPFNQIWLIERATRNMATWKEYDKFSQIDIFGGVNRTLEKYSGFGP